MNDYKNYLPLDWLDTNNTDRPTQKVQNCQKKNEVSNSGLKNNCLNVWREIYYSKYAGLC